MSRFPTTTTKVRTSFGAVFVHVDSTEAGSAVGVGIAYPGKFLHSEMGNALDAIAEAITDILRATPRPGTPAESGAPSAEQSATTPAPHRAGGSFEGAQDLECTDQ